MDRLAGKVAIVTGGASGIGEATTRMFVKQGAKVVIADLQEERGQSIAGELGDNCFYQKTDITRAADVRALVEAALQRFGKLDILVNSAGIVRTGVSIVDHSEEDFDRAIAVNLKGAWLCTKYAFPPLTECGNGAVVNIASIAGIIGNPGQTGYGASKGGLVQLTRHCATEGAERGIRVNSISPGGIVTAMSVSVRPGVPMEAIVKANAERNPLQRTGWPDDIAHAIVWLASDEARYVTGQNIAIDGGVSTLRMKINDLPTGS